MKSRYFLVLIFAVLSLMLFTGDSPLKDNNNRSCATFLFSHDSSLVVGHNLDENMKVPG